MPRGCDPEHPCAEYLKDKSFIASTAFRQAQACAPDFLARAEACKKNVRLMEFLADAVWLPW